MILQIQNLSFSFSEAPLLRDLSLMVEKGEIVCLLGPNGSGKTTLLDCVLGFHRTLSGKVSLCGKDVLSCTRQTLARQAAYVPQIHTPTFPYTVREVVLMGRTAQAGLLGAPGKEDRALCDAALRRVGIETFADRPYTALSGGELKRIEIATVLARNVKLAVFDEPEAGIDLWSFRNLTRIFENMRRSELTRTILVISHQERILNIADEIIVLSDGTVSRHGTKDEIMPELIGSGVAQTACPKIEEGSGENG